MKGWTASRMEAAGITPCERIYLHPWGYVLFGERLNKKHYGKRVAEVVETFWFLERDGIEVGRALEWEHLARPDGSLISREDRLLCAAADAGAMIPILVDHETAYREATYGDFAKAH